MLCLQLHCLFLLCYFSTTAQDQPVSVLTVNNGLSSGTVHCGLYDSRGFVWIGTREGLHRYDGKNVVKYLPDPGDSNAIRSQAIVTIAEDARGHLFLVGNKGFEVFLPEENRFKFITASPLHVTSGIARFLIIDSLDLGVLVEFERSEHVYFSLRDFHLIRKADLSEKSRIFVEQLWTTTYDFPSDTIYSVEGKAHLLFAFSRLEFFQFYGAEGYHIWASGLRQDGFYRFAFGKDRPEWIALSGFRDSYSDSTRLSFMDYNDTLALAAAGGIGIVLFHKKTGTLFKRWDFRLDLALGKVTAITFLFRDPAGRVWFSLMPYGVFVLDPQSPRFQVFKNGVQGSLLYNGLMRSMVVDTQGRLWEGYHDGHIQVFSPDLKKELYQWDNPFGHLSREITSLVLSPSGNPIANGRIEFLKEGNTFKPQDMGYGIDEPFIGFPSNTLGVPEYLAYYINTIERSDLLLVGKSGTSIHKCGCQSSYVTNQNDLICVHLNYLRIFHIAEDTLVPLHTQFIEQGVTSLYQPRGGDTLWMTSAVGLYTLNLRTYALKKLDTRSWPSQYLYGLIPDKHGYFWISSNAGIIRYHPETGEWRCFDVRDGMQSNEFNTNCFALMQDGSLAFGGPEGLNVFDPSYFDKKSVPFYVSLSDVRINELPIEGLNPYQPNVSFSIQPDEKSLEFTYTSTQYFDREDLHYYVQLVGAEKDWVDLGDKESVRYINLKPRQYTFLLKARNADGDWSVNTMEARVDVIPSFYQTTWFMVICILALGGILYGLYRYRINQLKSLQLLRNRISHDLHDDIGSTLGSISIYSEVAKTSTTENRYVVLEKIGEASREMLEKLNDIVWSINPENDHLERIESRMRTYAAMLLNPLGISFTITFDVEDPSKSLPMEKRRDLFLIYKEALHNAAKYSECKHIEVRVEEKHNHLRLQITDDGKGFNPNEVSAHNGNGVKSMRDRAIALNARFVLDSVPGKGTRIEVDEN